jgi:general stress protein YciG
MDFKRLSRQAKRLIDKRGGTDALKEDAEELRDIARGGGSMSDKAKAAADAVKEPGAEHEASREAPPPR